MTRRFRQRVVWLLILGFASLLCCAPGDVLAASAPPTIQDVYVGFGGKYKVGSWTPVVVTLAGGGASAGGRLEVVVSDPDGVKTRTTTLGGESVEIPAGKERSFLLYAKFGRVNGNLTVDFFGDGGRRQSKTFAARGSGTRPDTIPPAVLASQRLLVTVGHPIGVRDAIRRWQLDDSQRTVAVAVDRTDHLPDDWRGYEGVDTLIVTTGDPAIYRSFRGKQLDAIDRWVRMGGRLLLCVGANGRELLSPRSEEPLGAVVGVARQPAIHGSAGASPSQPDVSQPDAFEQDALRENVARWSRLVPGKFAGVGTRPTTKGLETYAEAAERLDAAGSDSDLKMTLLTDVRGRVDAVEELGLTDWPMIVRRPYGFGQITFLAADPDLPPLADWKGSGRLLVKLLEEGGQEQELAAGERGIRRVAHLGYQDLVGQLRGALEQFSGVTLVHFSWVATLIVLYIALIGPGDYFFLRKVLRRTQWTWLTFPLAIVAFCLLAYWLSLAYKGNRLRINQVDVVDIDARTSLVRGTTWIDIFSPRSENFDLRLTPSAELQLAQEPSGALLSWQGLPGRGLGGMNSAIGTELFTGSYAMVPDAESKAGASDVLTLRQMPIHVGSTKSCSARWWGKTSLGVFSDLSADSNNLLRGEIENPLPFELTRCVLFFERWAYHVQRLAPGERISVGAMRGPLNVEWVLTERTVIDQRDVATRWNEASTDVPRIARMMMFYDAAGGRAYTRLLHRYQAYVDLSGHLKIGRAVLVGRAAPRASQLERGGASLADHYDKHWTFFRIILPVASRGGEE